MTITELKAKFLEIYGGDGENLRFFASPGRVNLIGEHTDYNGGCVFPAALTMKTTIALRVRDDGIVRLAATDLPDRVTVDPANIDAYKGLRWGDYQAAVISELLLAGYHIVGCDMLYDDTTPHGGGLSSSAAIEVSTALAFATLSNESRGIDTPVDMVEMALVGQRAENRYIGVNCGIMDQFASAMGKKDRLIYLDCRDLSYELVPIQMDGYKIVISNTNKKRSLADSKYNERRAECEAALKLLQKGLPDKRYLGEISAAEFEAHKHLIDDPVLLKRAAHVILECDRVRRSVAALKNNDVAQFGQYMIASHSSLRDLYEVTGAELDTLVEEALKQEGVLGSRMTGAGFGGCTVSLVREDAVERFIDACGSAYEQKIGYPASFYVSEIGDGGRELK